MMFEIDRNLSVEEKEKIFHEFLVAEYLRYCSVDQVFKAHKYELPISYMGYCRILKRWGIIRAAGPNSSLAEVLGFLTKLVEERIPLETLYRKLPSTFQTSMSTMHRVLRYVKNGVTRRVGTALVVTPDNDRKLILVGNDVSTPRLELGKPYGAVSLPMGFSHKRDSDVKKVARVGQQEIFTGLTIERRFPNELFTSDLRPFMFVNIADVSVEVFHLDVPPHLIDGLFSFKLDDLRFVDRSDLQSGLPDGTLRTGMGEIAHGFESHLHSVAHNRSVAPLQITSSLNKQLLRYAMEFSG